MTGHQEHQARFPTGAVVDSPAGATKQAAIRVGLGPQGISKGKYTERKVRGGEVDMDWEVHTSQ